MALGMPIAFALIVCGVALMHSLDVFDSQIVAQNIINGADSFPLMAVPFFMLAGELMNRGGLARRIVNVALALVGHVKGGLGYVTILAACVLSSLSGSAAADAAALAALLVPMMVAAGHRKMYAAGLVAASGVIGPVIPPSIGFVLFGVTGGVSISKLFLAGIFPGLMLGVGPLLRLVVGRAWRGYCEPAAKVAARDRLGLRRRLLGTDAARDHRRRPAVRRVHADRGRRGRRRLRAVRLHLRLSRAEDRRTLRSLRFGRAQYQRRHVSGRRRAGLVLADHDLRDRHASRRPRSSLHGQPDAPDAGDHGCWSWSSAPRST